MIQKSFAAAGLAIAALAAAAAPATAIGDADGAAASIEGNGGTNFTGTVGNNSPNFHFLDNANICLPEVHNIAVGVLGVAVPVEVPIANSGGKQYCTQGQGTQSHGDGGVSHLVG
ncbi:rodlet layer protein [Kitasatospora aureofaciens]|uniref:rodlet layer protein n=1 Tax=Kitasatospora aureofaciens TaxID=1894 RepID=UPI001C489541|nr:rodlet layer protein [Kitasatospora aureofaciens]MBV6696297.1 rodlet layer protein [Kitasatospora aureofaciens]